MCGLRKPDGKAVLALQARELTVGVRLDGTLVPAIRSLSFDLQPGKILGLVGESGAGKTMIGRAIAQLLPPGFAITAGSLLFDGEDLVTMAPARRRALLGRAIAFIPQAPMTALNPVQDHRRAIRRAPGAARAARPQGAARARARHAGGGKAAAGEKTCWRNIRINCRAACASAC